MKELSAVVCVCNVDDNGDTISISAAVLGADLIEVLNLGGRIALYGWEYNENIYRVVIISPTWAEERGILASSVGAINDYISKFEKLLGSTIVDDNEIKEFE